MLLFFIYPNMKKIFFTTLLISFFACKNSENVVAFGMTSKLTLESGEINYLPLSKENVSDYEKFCYTESNEIFLNRLIANEKENYKIFIAVSETLHQSELPAVIKSDSSFTRYEFKKVSGKKQEFYTYFLKKNNSFITRVTYNEPNTGLLVIYDYSSSDSLKTRDYYKNIPVTYENKISFK